MQGYFSFTTPQVTAEEEKEERAALTEEEKRKIHNDMHGEDNGLEETPEMLSGGALLLREALDAIAKEDKLDYLEAVERNPRLVELECDLIAFLRSENYNAWVNRKSVYCFARSASFSTPPFVKLKKRFSSQITGSSSTSDRLLEVSSRNLWGEGLVTSHDAGWRNGR